MEKIDRHGLTEAEAIARYRQKNYPKPALTEDEAIFARSGGRYQLLLIRRGNHPFFGCLALPGGFADEEETIEATAARELREETGIEDVCPTLVGIYSQPGRDPRGWVVSAAYAALVDKKQICVRAGDDAQAAMWYDLSLQADGIRLTCGEDSFTIRCDASPTPELAFDHASIIVQALGTLDIRLS